MKSVPRPESGHESEPVRARRTYHLKKEKTSSLKSYIFSDGECYRMGITGLLSLRPVAPPTDRSLAQADRTKEEFVETPVIFVESGKPDDDDNE
jgi:hypothetical protein